jgi:hypothetical protein
MVTFRLINNHSGSEIMHASVIVALSPADLETAGLDPAGDETDFQVALINAVAHQMQPFNENGKWFDGSRWDWYSIGGRFSGKFAPLGYDPRTDAANLVQCSCCNGTGLRNDELGREHRKVEPGYKCNGCEGKGQQLKGAHYWTQVGNFIKRSELDEMKLREKRSAEAEKLWAEWEAEPHKDDRHREDYGLAQNDTRESLIAHYEQSYVTACAFLRDRKWYENAHMGFSGMPAKSECEIKAEERGDAFRWRCIGRDDETGAQIVSFTETDSQWDLLYWPRFIRNLAHDTTLVCVDCHI